MMTITVLVVLGGALGGVLIGASIHARAYNEAMDRMTRKVEQIPSRSRHAGGVSDNSFADREPTDLTSTREPRSTPARAASLRQLR